MRFFPLPFIFALFLGLQLAAQPYQVGIENNFEGYWQLKQVDNQPLPESASIYIQFDDNQLLLVNGEDQKGGRWAWNHPQRQFIVETDSTEIWTLMAFVPKRLLVLREETSQKLLTLSAMPAPPHSQFVQAYASDLLGEWLLSAVNDVAAQNTRSVSLQLSAYGRLFIDAGAEKDSIFWRMGPKRERIVTMVEPNNMEQSESWSLLQIDKESMEFKDPNGARLRFSRYSRPILPSEMKQLLGRWRIVEISGQGPEQLNYPAFEFLENGELRFFLGDQSTEKGAWGLSDTGDRFQFATSAGNESWSILYWTNKEMLLEMNNLKMVLIRE